MVILMEEVKRYCSASFKKEYNILIMTLKSPGFLNIGGNVKSRTAAELYSKSAVESIITYHNGKLYVYSHYNYSNIFLQNAFEPLHPDLLCGIETYSFF